jgi:hypothetical protein
VHFACARCRQAARLGVGVEVPQLGTSVFIIPRDRVKNGGERPVVLNSIASSVVEKRRGLHASHVFTYRDHEL